MTELLVSVLRREASFSKPIKGNYYFFSPHLSNLNHYLVIYGGGGGVACFVLNLNYVTMIYEGKIACSAFEVNYVIVICEGGGGGQHVLFCK